jgi:hypothetical protein
MTEALRARSKEKLLAAQLCSDAAANDDSAGTAALLAAAAATAAALNLKGAGGPASPSGATPGGGGGSVSFAVDGSHSPHHIDSSTGRNRSRANVSNLFCSNYYCSDVENLVSALDVISKLIWFFFAWLLYRSMFYSLRLWTRRIALHQLADRGPCRWMQIWAHLLQAPKVNLVQLSFGTTASILHLVGCILLIFTGLFTFLVCSSVFSL